jgi:hypothetical protein
MTERQADRIAFAFAAVTWASVLMAVTIAARLLW